MEIRNVAIIAHVDHGKTTLVDALLRQSKTQLDKEIEQNDCILDSHELERERGITIFAKNASVVWNGVKINIIDTPGHVDFSGEVERVLKMADGSLLLVDAQEGPMPQTRFVLKKALELRHPIIVVINKIDKADADIEDAVNRTLDLFIELGADDKGIDFPIIYASAKLGKAGSDPDLNKTADASDLFQKIIDYIPSPDGDPELPLQMLVTSVGFDNFKGRIARGRIYNGSLKAGQEVILINRQNLMKKYKIASLATFEGLGQIDVDQASAGEIVAIAGIPEIMIGETVTDAANPRPLPLLKIEEPTVKMTFAVNSSPFAGKEGKFNTSRQIRERLLKELENDVALKIEDSPEGKFIVSGRGELHLGILIERLRREGYEFEISQPQVIIKEVDGQRLVPYEKIFIDVPEPYSGPVIQKLSSRGGQMREFKTKGMTVHLEFVIPSGNFFGYRHDFLTDTRGLGVMNTLFYDYLPDKGVAKERERGSLVASQSGVTSLYGLTNIQQRGDLFVGPATPIYKGQIVGQNSRRGDIRVNVCKEKHLSNMRSKGEGGMAHFNVPRVIDLEESIEYIDGTELIEVTPQSTRLRKIVLDETEEKRKRKGMIGAGN